MDTSAVNQAGRRQDSGFRSSWLLQLWLLVVLMFVPAVLPAAEKPFGGVGLQVVPTATGELAVLNVIPGSPAERGGLRPGDLIIQVDRLSLRGSDFTEVVSRHLWGEIGQPVTLIFLRPGQKGRRSGTLRRVAMDPEAAAPPGVEMIQPRRENLRGE